MANQQKSLADLKPGSSKADAAALSGRGDFGVHESDVVERTYTSENTKMSDPGHAQPKSYEHIGSREAGVDGNDSGPGSSSGGDLDPQFVGLDGAGLATDIDKHAPRTAAEAIGDTSRNAASGGPSQNPSDASLVGKVGGPHPQVNVVTPPDDRTLDVGADAVSNTSDTDIDDSFRGEISSADASGRDTRGK